MNPLVGDTGAVGCDVSMGGSVAAIAVITGVAEAIGSVGGVAPIGALQARTAINITETDKRDTFRCGFETKHILDPLLNSRLSGTAKTVLRE